MSMIYDSEQEEWSGSDLSSVPASPPIEVEEEKEADDGDQLQINVYPRQNSRQDQDTERKDGRGELAVDLKDVQFDQVPPIHISRANIRIQSVVFNLHGTEAQATSSTVPPQKSPNTPRRQSRQRRRSPMKESLSAVRSASAAYPAHPGRTVHSPRPEVPQFHHGLPATQQPQLQNRQQDAGAMQNQLLALIQGIQQSSSQQLHQHSGGGNWSMPTGQTSNGMSGGVGFSGFTPVGKEGSPSPAASVLAAAAAAEDSEPRLPRPSNTGKRSRPSPRSTSWGSDSGQKRKRTTKDFTVQDVVFNPEEDLDEPMTRVVLNASSFGSFFAVGTLPDGTGVMVCRFPNCRRMYIGSKDANPNLARHLTSIHLEAIGPFLRRYPKKYRRHIAQLEALENGGGQGGI